MTSQSSHDKERELLGFAQAVTIHIEPVVVALGFRQTHKSCYAVVYESPKVLVNVIHDPLSYHIEVEFQRKEKPSACCTLSGIMASESGYCGFQVSTADRVNVAIENIARLLQTHGMEALSGDPETYQRLAKETHGRSVAYTKVIMQQPVRVAAENAWQRQDYAQVRNLYESLGTDLSAVEKRRLEYARSHAPEC